MNGIKNKYSYIAVFMIEIILTIALYFWNDLKIAKMGIVRHITFWNAYRFPEIFTTTVLYIISGILGVFIFLQLLKISKLAFLGQIEISVNLFLYLISMTFIFQSSAKEEFIYYYIVIYIILMNVLQFLKTFFYEKK